MAESIDHGRAAFAAGRWLDAFAGLRSATARIGCADRGRLTVFRANVRAVNRIARTNEGEMDERR